MKRVLFATIICCFFQLLTEKSMAQPAGWSLLSTYTITNNSSTPIYNYQAPIIVNTAALVAANQMQSSGNDIRFGKDCSGTILYNHFLDSGMNSSATKIWVKIDTIPANGNRVFYMFYGNPNATSASTFSTFIGPFSSTQQVISPTAGGVSNCQRGFRFSPNEPILISEFGKREPTGTTRYVTIFNYSTQAIVRQSQVTGGAATYTYTPLADHLWLQQGTQYVLQLFQGSGDGYYYGTSSQIATQLTYYDMRYCNSCTQNTFPTNVLNNYHYGNPDFNFYTRNNVTPAPVVTSGGVGGGNVTVVNQPTDTLVCAGSPASFSILTSPALPSGFQWQVNTGSGFTNLTNNATYSGVNTNTLVINPTAFGMNNYVYRVSINGACGGNIVSNSATLHINPGPYTQTGATITGSANNICAGTMVTFNGSVVGEGTSPVYEWQINGNTVGGNNLTFSTTALNNGDNVRLVMHSSANCPIPPVTISNSIAMNVTPVVVPDVQISASTNNVCQGTPINFTAAGTGGGTAPQYQWKLNGNNVGTNTNTYSNSNLTTNDVVTCILSSNANCKTKDFDTSNKVYMVIIPTAHPAVTITGSSELCEDQFSQYYAGAVDGGSNPSFQWKLNGNNVGTNSPNFFSSTLQSGDILSCEMTSNAACAATNFAVSNNLNMTVNPKPQPTITLTGNLLSTTPFSTYQWFKNSAMINGATAQTYMATSGGSYWVRVTNAFGCENISNIVFVKEPGTNGVQSVPLAKEINIYPNPAHDYLNVDAPQKLNLVLKDIQGKIILDKKQTNGLDLKSISNGVYLLNIFDEDGQLIRIDKVEKL